MALPSLGIPEFETKIPSSQQTIRFRPFLVKEEKILFMALQGNDPKEMNRAVTTILSACVLSENFDVNDLSLYDVEYLFLQLRGKSVGEVIELKIKHTNETECSHASDIQINLEDINVHFPEGFTNKIEITDQVGIQMRHPGIQQTHIIDQMDNLSFESVLELIADCVVCIYDENNVYDTFTKKEIVEFLENLNQNQFGKIQNFFADLPKLKHKIEWTCPVCEQPDQITVEGLASFFT